MDNASLLNRVLFHQRSALSGKQVFTTGQVGCYKAHVAIWRQIPPNETWLVLEHDAVVLPHTIGLLRQLTHSVSDEYEYINLLHRYPVPTAITSPVTELLRECPRYQYDCTPLHTTAYLLTHSGAQKLLQHAFPIEVPVDWYIATLRDYNDPSFTYAFTAHGFFGLSGRPSQVGHRCFICKLPTTALGMICFLTALTLGSLLLGVLGTISWGRYRRTAQRRPRTDDSIHKSLGPDALIECLSEDTGIADRMLDEKIRRQRKLLTGVKPGLIEKEN
eukprot:2217122-Rhodomonas_salina.2